MADQAPPSIPPRPVKAQAAAQGVSALPLVPPRPANKAFNREPSPNSFPRSPLDEPYSFTKPRSTAPTSTQAPSISRMPLTGEEGMEYQNVQYQPSNPSSSLAQDAPAQQRTIAEDLHLHAPKPSLSAQSATAQVQSVTRTDSAHAPSHSVDRATHDDLSLSRTRSRGSFSRPDSAASTERRKSLWAEQLQEGEHGLRVPINPLLGDVQAPTPSMSPQVTGQSARNHGRRKSGLDAVRPPDSYGLHGHGIIPHNKLEREWYERHPEALEQEEGQAHGVYESIGAGRGSFAMSSDELNKLVRSTPSRGAGFGTNEKIGSYPDEQIGYMASEEYSKSRGTTPQPESLSRVHTHDTRPLTESPLRKQSFPASEAAAPGDAKAASMGHGTTSSTQGVVHVDEPERKYNKVTGGQGSLDETQEAKPYASHPEEDGHEYRVPILAEDEVAKDPAPEHLHPAVSPKFERRPSMSYDDHTGSAPQTPTSRPSSRPGSVYQLHNASHSLSRFISHNDNRDLSTPLEDVVEYEPLFDDEDESERKPMTTAERFKQRPGSLAQRFPSQDIWESAPESTYHEASVSTPDLATPQQPSNTGQGPSAPKAAAAFETPDQERARKGEVTEAERKQLKPQEERLLGSKWLPHLRDDMPGAARPMGRRFPSSDIWESAPESSEHTTIIYPKDEEEMSPRVESVPTRDLGRDAPASSDQTDPSVPPQIPSRPQKKAMHAVPAASAELTEPIALNQQTSRELQGAPGLPDRPKPHIPPRPAKKMSGDELSRTNTAGSEGSTTERDAKQKPQVPARPAGVTGALASLKGNFMNDLNKKLGLGPPKEKEKVPEAEVEAKPLEDSRKSRARGPQRRAPARSPAAETTSAPPPVFAISPAFSIWQIDENDRLGMITEVKANQHSHTHPPARGGLANVELPADAQSISMGATGSTPTQAAERLDSTISDVDASALPEKAVESAQRDESHRLGTETKAVEESVRSHNE